MSDSRRKNLEEVKVKDRSRGLEKVKERFNEFLQNKKRKAMNSTGFERGVSGGNQEERLEAVIASYLEYVHPQLGRHESVNIAETILKNFKNGNRKKVWEETEAIAEKYNYVKLAKVIREEYNRSH